MMFFFYIAEASIQHHNWIYEDIGVKIICFIKAFKILNYNNLKYEIPQKEIDIYKQYIRTEKLKTILEIR